MRLCYCGKDAGRTELGYRQLLHPHHRAGTSWWMRWYPQHHQPGESEAADLLLAHYHATASARAASLAKLKTHRRTV